MVLTKVSGDLISIISDTGATSSFAATRGRRFYREQQHTGWAKVYRDGLCRKSKPFWHKKEVWINKDTKPDPHVIILCRQSHFPTSYLAESRRASADVGEIKLLLCFQDEWSQLLWERKNNQKVAKIVCLWHTRHSEQKCDRIYSHMFSCEPHT